MCLSDEEIPKDLLPINNNIGTVRPIIGPAMYQGHGFLINSMISIVKIKVLSTIYTG